jgi:D-alanyl-lipoteichoic acid acyltransferase DltB (MBOAT superfamily)|tara:strand:- start:5267 stop:6565 length:1299 start_codon:yes stop_codon:yes gene_type:complete
MGIELSFWVILFIYFLVLIIFRKITNDWMAVILTSIVIGACFYLHSFIFIFTSSILCVLLLNSKKLKSIYIVVLLLFFIFYKSILVHSNFHNLSLSYFLFNIIGLLVDSSKMKYKKISSVQVLARLLFLPALIQGPILKIKEFNLKSKNSSFYLEDINNGGVLFLWGLYKYYVVSYFFSSIFYSLYESGVSGLYVLLLGFLFFIDVYLKFSSSIDMVIGLSRCVGIHLPLNFHGRVYFSNTRIKFWSGWNLTLNNWFKNYFLLYFFESKRQNTIKLMVIPTCFLIGLWHGFSNNFILWGLLNGILIFIELKIKIRYPVKKKYNLLFVINQLVLNSFLFLILLNDFDLVLSILDPNQISVPSFHFNFYLFFGVNILLVDIVEKSFSNKGFVSFFSKKTSWFKYIFTLFLISQLLIFFFRFNMTNTAITYYDKF